MATAPNCKKNSERARLRRSHHLGHNKEDAEWSKKLDSNKYPKCVGKKIFDDCPDTLEDKTSPPSGCKSCPQYVPTVDERKKRMQELLAIMKKSQ